MQKILILTLEYPPQVGGISSYIWQTIQNWPEQSDQFFVLAPKIKGDTEFDKNSQHKVFRYNQFFCFIWPSWLKMFIQTIVVCIKHKPDIIFVHHVLPVGYISWLIKKIFKIPYIVFLHGMDFGLATKDVNKQNKTNHVLNSAQKIVVNSKYLNKAVVKIYPNISNRVTVVYPCSSISKIVSIEKLKAVEDRYNLQARPLLLSVGRLIERKGFDVVLKALPLVLKEEPDLLYIICGNGPEKSNLEKLVENNNLKNNVKFIIDVSGLDKDSDLPALYSLSNVFIMPAKEGVNNEIEGFGIVFLEAALFAKPSIAGKSGGMPEAIEDKVTGLLVNPNNIQEVASSILKLFKNKQLAKKMGQAGQKRTEEVFAWSQQLKKIIN